MVENLTNFCTLLCKIQHKSITYTLHILEVGDISHIKFSKSFSKCLSIQDTDVFCPELLLAQGYVFLIIFSILLFAEELDFLQWVDFFESISCFWSCDMKKIWGKFCMLCDEVGDVAGIEYCLEYVSVVG